MMNDGRQVRLYLVDGTAGGLITAEIMNWTGHLVTAPRSDLARLLQRPESKRTGVYILIGDAVDDTAPFDRTLYVGEGDVIATRLKAHAQPTESGGKDFWDRVVVVTSKDANLTKAHARFLEARLIQAAHSARRAVVTNGSSPQPLPLPEADVGDMEYFLAQVHTILPVLGIDELKNHPKAKDAAKANTQALATSHATGVSPTFVFHMAQKGITAKAQEVDDEFVVLEGSGARVEWVLKGTPTGYRLLHEKLVQNGTIKVKDGRAFFTKDTAFTSPSAAAAVVAGTNINGKISWLHETTKMTFGDWQRQGIDLGSTD